MRPNLDQTHNSSNRSPLKQSFKSPLKESIRLPMKETLNTHSKRSLKLDKSPFVKAENHNLSSRLPLSPIRSQIIDKTENEKSIRLISPIGRQSSHLPVPKKMHKKENKNL